MSAHPWRVSAHAGWSRGLLLDGRRKDVRLVQDERHRGSVRLRDGSSFRCHRCCCFRHGRVAGVLPAARSRHSARRRTPNRTWRSTLPGGLRLAFDTEDTIRSFDASWSTPARAVIASPSPSRATSPADVDATYAALVASGSDGHLPPWDAFWGQRYAIVLDPDGNHVELFAPLEVS